MKTSLTIFLLVLLLGNGSCRKEKEVLNTIGSEVYPYQTGNYWKYSFTSSTGSPGGTLEVTVAGDCSFPGGKTARIWIYRYPGFTDSIYKIVTDHFVDEFSFIPSPSDIPYAQLRFEFPMLVGNGWATNPNHFSDSASVVSLAPLTVPAATFDTAYQVNMSGSHYIGNYWNNSKYWFTPKVGIARMEISIFSLGPDEHNGTYELLEYRLR